MFFVCFFLVYIFQMYNFFELCSMGGAQGSVHFESQCSEFGQHGVSLVVVTECLG